MKKIKIYYQLIKEQLEIEHMSIWWVCLLCLISVVISVILIFLRFQDIYIFRAIIAEINIFWLILHSFLFSAGIYGKTMGYVRDYIPSMPHAGSYFKSLDSSEAPFHHKLSKFFNILAVFLIIIFAANIFLFVFLPSQVAEIYARVILIVFSFILAYLILRYFIYNKFGK